MNTFLIGITGEIGSGKSTVARILSGLTDSYIGHFAEPGKRACKVIFGLSEDDVSTQEGKSTFNEAWGMTNRDLLRVTLTDALKPFFGADMWVKRQELALKDKEFPRCIFADVRFPEEARWVREHGILIHVEREDNPYRVQMSEHASDAGVPFLKGDWKVINNGDIVELTQRLLVIIGTTPELRDAANNCMGAE